MSNNDKQYTIYLRSAEPGKRRVPCTKQQFDDYYRDINAYRRTQMNHGRCVCPPSRWLHCDMDCCTCPHRTSGDISYLDDSRVNILPQTGQQNGGNRSRVTVEMSPGVRLQVQAVE